MGDSVEHDSISSSFFYSRNKVEKRKFPDERIIASNVQYDEKKQKKRKVLPTNKIKLPIKRKNSKSQICKSNYDIPDTSAANHPSDASIADRKFFTSLKAPKEKSKFDARKFHQDSKPKSMKPKSMKSKRLKAKTACIGKTLQTGGKESGETSKLNLEVWSDLEVQLPASIPQSAISVRCSSLSSSPSTSKGLVQSDDHESSQSSVNTAVENDSKENLVPRFYSIFNQTESQKSVRGKKFLSSSTDCNQMTLDAGQKVIGLTSCGMCGMTYTLADSNDEKLHAKFHSNRLTVLHYKFLKRDNIVQDNLDGSKIICTDPNHQSVKIRKIRAIVDEELGFSATARAPSHLSKIYLFMSNSNMIIGLCIAEPVQKAFRVIKDTVPVSCEATEVPAICGINRIWVLQNIRRQRIASQLVDCIRNTFMLGKIISKESLAFTDPTMQGLLFASKYMGRKDFLVYKESTLSL